MRQPSQNADTLRPPSADQSFIESLETFLKPGARVLDIGAGRGQNALYLANIGYDVVAVESEPEYIEAAQAFAHNLGKQAIRLSFEQGDIREMTFGPESFDAVIMTRVLQEFESKEESKKLIACAQRLTQANGYNCMVAYTGSMADQVNVPHLAIFYPGEVQELYDASGWNVAHSNQNIRPVHQTPAGPRITATDELVAQKCPANTASPSKKQYEQRQLEYWSRVDPEYGETLSLLQEGS